MPRSRRVLAWTTLAIFASQFVLLGVLARGERYWHDEGVVLSAVTSIALWGVLGAAAGHRVVRVVVALVAASTLVIEVAFFRYYHTFIGDDAVATAQSMWSDVGPVLKHMLPALAAGVVLAGSLEYLLLLGRSWPGRRAYLAIAVAIGGLVVWTTARQRASFELQSIWSLRLGLRPRQVKAITRLSVPNLESQRNRLPNVLLILDESVRASDYSLAEIDGRDPSWRTLIKERIELSEMRSLSSYTTISVHAMLGGILPLGTRETVACTPLVFDYLRAIHAGGERPRVLYWSAHQATVFERSDPRQMADSVAFIDDILGRQPESTEEVVELGADRRVADWVARNLPSEPRPLFLLAHLIDTHAPYHVERDITPFTPYSHAATWTGLDALHNAYRNAIVAQDRSVQAIVRTFLDAVGSEPYFILFTSDHGEAFGEHKAIHHGQNVYDEQIHVPAWIAFGNAAVSSEQEHWLRAHARDFVTHVDILPTLLDLYGSLDSFALVGIRKRFVGRSLLRPFAGSAGFLPISNCTALFPCPLRCFGLLKDDTAIVAQPWDDGWRCVRLNAGNSLLAEDTPLCIELRRASKTLLPTLPNGEPNR